MESSIRASPRAAHRKKPSVSLFPDPSRHQFSTNNLSRSALPTTVRPAAASTTPSPPSASEESLTGLAKARQRALDAKKRTQTDQSALNLSTTQPPKGNFSRICGRLTCQVETIVAPGGAKSESPEDPVPRTRSPSPNKLRRKLSKTLRRRSKSVDFDAGMKMSISAPLEATVLSPIRSGSALRPAPTPWAEPRRTDLTPETSVSALQEKEKLTRSNSAPRLLKGAEIKKSRHTRQASSVSSAEIDVEPNSEKEPCAPLKRSRSRSASSTRRPFGVSPEQAARILPSSVKSALGLHAHSESMGYMVLLPHEVVQLNDVLPAIESRAHNRNTCPSKRK